MSEPSVLGCKSSTSVENLANFMNLCDLNANNPADSCQDLNLLLSKEIEACVTKLGLIAEEIPNLVEHLKQVNPNDNSDEWKYICLNFYFLEGVQDVELSVQQTLELKNVFRNLVTIGIASNLQPNLPYFTKLAGENRERSDVFGPYKRLLGSIYGFCKIVNSNRLLKSLVASNYLKWILCGFYQILYCPLMRPSSSAALRGPFVITEAIYTSLMEEREALKAVFELFATQIHPVLYVRETMMLSRQLAPNWMKRAVATNLNKALALPNGLECVARALLDATELEDTTEGWKTLDVIGKLVLDFYKFGKGNSKENICQQVLGLLDLRDGSSKPIPNFERLFNLCTKLIFQEDSLLCEKLLIDNLLASLLCFTKADTKFENKLITESISQTMRLLGALVVEDNFNAFLIPVRVSLTSLNVIFHIYSVTFEDNNFFELNNNINSLLVKVLHDLQDQQFTIFDNFLFGLSCSNCSEMHEFQFFIKNNALYVTRQEYSVTIGPLDRAKLLEKVVKKEPVIKASFFTYLLNCLINRDKYFRRDFVNRDLLQVESQFVLDEVSERNLAVCKLLSELTEDKALQKQIIENPTDVIRYIYTVLNKSVTEKVHQSDDSEGFQVLFVIVMLLQAFIETTLQGNLNHYNDVIEPLRVISRESTNDELKNLCKKILSALLGEIKGEASSHDNSTTKTELEKAIEDICDPLLPVRGHGLMTLTKLIQTKDKHALERKRYVMNIFQENLKNDDSFIYLNAIGGLAAMGDLYPDMVLNVLIDEYSDFSEKDFEKSQEVRMKLGEVLLRVTKSLGETAPKYKAILLNAFLLGTKDDDYLIRASSLSNLGEICRVLGYKLGSSITEILVCVHAIITTDKAPEARRAAITVIRQLFVGLEKEMIVFLKDEILPIYRTLKNVYNNDSDDVMKLQAQLALEQLNENMKDFIFPNPRINTEKKGILL